MDCDLFLVAGQSNAAGNGDPFDEALDGVEVPGVWQWDSTSQSVIPAISPLKHHTAQRRTCFGYHFGVLYKRATGRDIVLIPRAKNGSRLYAEFWQPGLPGGEGYESAIKETNAAILSTGGPLCGILWHQGEADTALMPTEETHSARLAELAAGLRARITGAARAVFLCGGMVPDWVTATPEAVPVEAALANISKYCAWAGYIPAEGLSGNQWVDDTIHFNAESQRQLGLRYLWGYFKIAQASEVATDPAPGGPAGDIDIPGGYCKPIMNSPSQPNRYKFSLAACGRWEENDVVEWIEYHRAIGIEHFYIYSNDDSPVTLLKVLAPYMFQQDSIVTFRHWPVAGQQPQIYFHFLQNFKHETEWFSFLDMDEFLVFKTTNSIHTFMAQFEHTHDAVYLNWLIYGNNHLIERDKDSVLFAYTRRSKTINHHTKVITRSAAVDAAFVEQQYLAGTIGFWHFWNDYGLAPERLTNAIGGRVDDYTKEFPKYAIEQVCRQGVSDLMINTAYVAHFQFKSEQDFIRRAERGGFPMAASWQKIHEDGSYKDLLNTFNAVEDSYLAAFWARKVGHLYNTAAMAPAPVPSYPNVALRKPSRQSSILPTPVPPGAHLQGHGNDGVRTRCFGFHTNIEDAPWWEVDLLAQYSLKEIHIYNRDDAPGVAERAASIAVEASRDGLNWSGIFANDPATPFFGFRRGPLIIKLGTATIARYLRVISRVPTFLHLDEVEVYGAPLR
jgi:hypothetical protein